MDPFLLSAICILNFMIVMFVIAQVIKNNSIADIGWGLGFIMVAIVTLFHYDHYESQQQLVTFLVVMWGLRLFIYILLRNWGKPEDWRYARWRADWGKTFFIRSFLQVFVLQGCIMFLVALPVIVINSNSVVQHQRIWMWGFGSLVWLIGFFFETLGDLQMYLFKTDPHHHGKVMQSGLWHYTRHPNYFGEALQWWGIFMISVPSGNWYVSIISPIVITFLLLRVSGVTLLEKRFDGDDEYSEYKKHTSAFIPWFRKKMK